MHKIYNYQQGKFNPFLSKLNLQQTTNSFNQTMQQYTSLGSLNKAIDASKPITFSTGNASTGFAPIMNQKTGFGSQSTNMITGETTKDFSKPTGTQTTTTSSTTTSQENISKNNPNPGQAAGVGLVASGVGSVMNAVGDSLYNYGGYDKNSANSAAKSTRTAISDAAISSGDPTLMVIGAATKLIDGAMDATGLRGENISKKDAEKVGISGVDRFINNFNNFLPGNPLAVGGKELTKSEKSIDAEELRGAFTGTLDDMDTAKTYGGRRLNVFSSLTGTTNKMDSFIEEQNRRNTLLTSLNKTNTLRKQSDYNQELNTQNFNKYNGKNYQSTAVGKEGIKLPDRELLNRIYNAKKIESISEFKKGGVIGIDSSVIPEGVLHKELNHMEEHNEELDKKITDKGIAVVTTDKEGKVEQVAEIEKEEIIFSKTITEQIEDLWKQWKEIDDEEKISALLLKAGKILTKEIVTNTDDNTGELLNGDN